MNKLIITISFIISLCITNSVSAFFWDHWFKNQEIKEVPIGNWDNEDTPKKKLSPFEYQKNQNKLHTTSTASLNTHSLMVDSLINSFWADDWMEQFLNNDPFMARHRNIMKRLQTPFHNTHGSFSHLNRGFSSSRNYPLDLEDRGDHLLATIDIPNLDPANVSVEVKNNGSTLMVKSKEIIEKREEDQGQFYYRERSSGQFLRQISLPHPVEKDKTKASFKNGSLRISMPKKIHNEQTTDKIEISIE